MHNIEKSGFRAGEYVGYGGGRVYRISKHGGYWNAVSQEKPTTHFTAKTLRELSAMIDAPKKNPAPKRKTAARTMKAAVGYVNRPSQITKKAPTKRLKKRRTVNLQSPRGVFPNPKTRSSLEKTSSWVIRNKKTGEVIMETFDIKKVNALNTAKYEAVPILKYLQELNSGIKKNPSTVHFDIDVNSHNARGAKAKTRVNPSARKKQIVVEYELSGQKFAIRNRGMYGWKELATFPDTPEGSENAIQYAQAYHNIAPHLRIQVVTK